MKKGDRLIMGDAKYGEWDFFFEILSDALIHLQIPNAVINR